MECYLSQIPMTQAHRFGHYEILSRLGHGGMADVYLAQDLEGPRAGWKVAVKRLHPTLAQDPEYVALFRREAELSTWLEHPNIVKVYESGAVGPVLFMAMEWVDGCNLGDIVRRCKARGIQLPADFAVYLVKTLLGALAFAHAARDVEGREMQVVHCDVSPSNLFISRTGEVKLGDFGVASARTGGAVNQAMVVGKPYYVSPELWDGRVTTEADLWAAGVTLYELLTLERPFSGHTPEAVAQAVKSAHRRPVRALRPEVSPALEAVIDRALHLSPEARFPGAVEFAQGLRPHWDERIATPQAIAAVVRGLFGWEDR